MAGGVNAIGNLQGKVSSTNALVVTLDGGVGSASRFMAGDGTAPLPAFSFTSDGTNGMYLAGTDILGFATAGVEAARMTATGALTTAAGISATTGGIAVLSANGFFQLGARGYVEATADGAWRLNNNAGTGFSRLDFGPAGAATTRGVLQKKVTAIADNTATAVVTVTVPNANHAAGIKLKFLSSNGSTDAFESSRVAEGFVVLARTTGVATVAVAATLEMAAIATVGGGATHTLAYSLSAISGAVGATQTFTINVTIDDNGNLGSNQVVVIAEVINAEATGVTIA